MMDPLERLRGEDWENACHELFWEAGNIEQFELIQRRAEENANERAAALSHVQAPAPVEQEPISYMREASYTGLNGKVLYEQCAKDDSGAFPVYAAPVAAPVQVNALEGWRYSINYGPDGQEDWANLITPEGEHVANIHTCHAIRIVAALAVEHGPVATVVWYDPRTDMLLYERPHKIIDASVDFIEAAPIGTKLYAAPVAAPVQEWQDISTAPKDWSDMLLFDTEYPNDHHKVFQGYYDPDENDWLDAQNVVVHPTHWQPLPTPPALRAISGDTSNG